MYEGVWSRMSSIGLYAGKRVVLGLVGSWTELRWLEYQWSSARVVDVGHFVAAYADSNFILFLKYALLLLIPL